MKRLTLFLLLTFLTVSAPWRLMAVGAEMFFVQPGSTHLTQTTTHYWEAEALETRLMSLGWSVVYANGIIANGAPAYGVTVMREHAIAVDASLRWDERFAVLAHEAGHTHQPFWVDGIEADCFAESVAVVLAHDGFREHARYLASRRWTCAAVMIAEWQAIYHAAATLKD